MAPPPHGQTAVMGVQPVPESPASFIVPPPPADYLPSRLRAQGYTTMDVAAWAERRICDITGSSSLHAKRSFQAGAVLSEFGARAIVDTPNYLTVQVGDARHIMLSPEYLQYINHSCTPNVFFDTAAYQLIAVSDIAPGDELCFFYPSTEWSMESPFDCRCGTPACCGTIAGAGKMNRQRLSEYKLTQYIQSKLASTEQA